MDICKYRFLYLNEILSILESKKICSFITTTSDNDVNITPMWYTFDYDTITEKLTFYFINMNNEKNINQLKNTDKICISLENYTVGFYIDAYQSISAYGTSEFIDDPNEKESVLLKFKKKYSPDSNSNKYSHFKYLKINIINIIGRQY